MVTFDSICTAAYHSQKRGLPEILLVDDFSVFVVVSVEHHVRVRAFGHFALRAPLHPEAGAAEAAVVPAADGAHGFLPEEAHACPPLLEV